MTEKEVRKMIKEFLAKTGAWQYHTHQHGYRAFRGISDIGGSYHQKHFFIECKSDGGRLRPEQKTFLEQANQEGFYCFVAFDFESFYQWWNKEMN
jgi:hypothetical protein